MVWTLTLSRNPPCRSRWGKSPAQALPFATVAVGASRDEDAACGATPFVYADGGGPAPRWRRGSRQAVVD